MVNVQDSIFEIGWDQQMLEVSSHNNQINSFLPNDLEIGISKRFCGIKRPTRHDGRFDACFLGNLKPRTPLRELITMGISTGSCP